MTAMAILSALNGIATWYRADGTADRPTASPTATPTFSFRHSIEPHFMTRTIT